MLNKQAKITGKYKPIADIADKISDFLNAKQLTPTQSIKKTLSYPKRHSYFSKVVDSNHNPLFLKIRTRASAWERETFKNQYLIGKILSSNPKLALASYVPKFIDGAVGKFDYLLFEYLNIENMGSRINYDVIKLKNSDINAILKIITALRKFPVRLLPENFTHRKSSFFQQLIAGSQYLKQPPIRNLLNKHWQLFDKHAQYLAHGDFKPNNIVRSNNAKLLLVDFEEASISNPYTDIASLWAYAVKKPNWRKNLIGKFINKNTCSECGLAFLRINMLIHAMFEVKLLRKKSKLLQNQYLKDRLDIVEKLLDPAQSLVDI